MRSLPQPVAGGSRSQLISIRVRLIQPKGARSVLWHRHMDKSSPQRSFDKWPTDPCCRPAGLLGWVVRPSRRPCSPADLRSRPGTESVCRGAEVDVACQSPPTEIRRWAFRSCPRQDSNLRHPLQEWDRIPAEGCPALPYGAVFPDQSRAASRLIRLVPPCIGQSAHASLTLPDTVLRARSRWIQRTVRRPSGTLISLTLPAVGRRPTSKPTTRGDRRGGLVARGSEHGRRHHRPGGHTGER